MFTRQAPPRSVLLHGQSMGGSEIPFEHLAAPAAFEANNIIAMNRSADRYGGGPLRFGFDCRFSESDKRCVHCRD
jgi:hypothetical protein